MLGRQGSTRGNDLTASQSRPPADWIAPLVPRTLVRPLSARDREEIISLTLASRELHHPWVHPPASSREFADLLSRCERDDFVSLLVCLRSTAAIAGVFNLSQIFRGSFQNAYLGYFSHARYAGQGYMAEGMQLVLHHAFDVLALHRIEANIQPGNTASLRLAARAGFRREGFSPRYLQIGGHWRDHERWAILAEDWRAAARLATAS